MLNENGLTTGYRLIFKGVIMKDLRIIKLAKNLVNYSCAVKKGEKVMIEAFGIPNDLVKELLAFYMGKNTMERQNFIIDNLVVEEDITKEE